MTQTELALPLRALARATDPQTSKDAAAKLDAPKLIDRVHAHLKLHGEMTMQTCAEQMELPLTSVSPRFAPLARSNRIEAARREGGRIVWRAI